MAVELITKQDLDDFARTLLQSISEMLTARPEASKKWLKSTEVKKILGISSGTLQTLRINKTLSYTKIGGIIYYASQDLDKLLEANKVSSERTLFNSK